MAATIPVEPCMTTSEIADVLRKSAAFVRELLRTGRLPGFKIGKRRWLVSSTALRQWILSQTEGE